MWNQTEVKWDPVKDREGLVAKAGTGNKHSTGIILRGGGAVIYYITIVVREI